MQRDLIREIAEAIVRDQILLNWRVYFLVVTLGALAGMAGYWLAPYLKKRAEVFATKADMHEVLHQVTLTTRATEQVRSAIGKADWAAREWQTIRRLKLEELLSSAYSLDKWLDFQQAKWLHNEEIDINDKPTDTLRMLAALYFPELKSEVSVVWMAYLDACLFILNKSDSVRAARSSNDIVAYEASLKEFRDGWSSFYSTMIAANSALEIKASQVMATFAGA